MRARERSWERVREAESAWEKLRAHESFRPNESESLNSYQLFILVDCTLECNQQPHLSPPSCLQMVSMEMVSILAPTIEQLQNNVFFFLERKFPECSWATITYLAWLLWSTLHSCSFKRFRQQTEGVPFSYVESVKSLFGGSHTPIELRIFDAGPASPCCVEKDSRMFFTRLKSTSTGASSSDSSWEPFARLFWVWRVPWGKFPF